MNIIWHPRDSTDSSHVWEENGKFFRGWICDESTSRKPDRIFEGKEEITELVYNQTREEWEALAREMTLQAKKEKMEREIEEIYLASIPTSIVGLKKGPGRNGEYVDEYGNYILSIPRRAWVEQWPLEKLAAYMEDYVANYDGD